jgi:hypothetical protein
VDPNLSSATFLHKFYKQNPIKERAIEREQTLRFRSNKIKGRKKQNENAKKQDYCYCDCYLLNAFNVSFNDASTKR